MDKWKVLNEATEAARLAATADNLAQDGLTPPVLQVVVRAAYVAAENTRVAALAAAWA